MHNSLIRMRGSPSIAEFDGNKKQKIACEFYAKGWCIKGNSCRFLHVNEGSDATARGSEDKSEGNQTFFWYCNIILIANLDSAPLLSIMHS